VKLGHEEKKEEVKEKGKKSRQGGAVHNIFRYRQIAKKREGKKEKNGGEWE